MATTDRRRKKGASILVVEDSATQALQLQGLLEKHGYKVQVAANGAGALERLKENPMDLVISDIVMPGMDGYALCRAIKEDDRLRGIPVLLLTQLTEAEDIVKGLEAGADNFVTKPYEPELLISRVQYILVNRIIRTVPRTEMGIEVFFAGKKHFINSDRIQILDLLFSTYENSLRQKRELERLNRELQKALDTIKRLHGILPICSSCKKIRDDKGAWSEMEAYIMDHSEAQFSHGICPECVKKLYPDLVDD